MSINDLDEKTFKTTYIATFLASYMAVNYDNDCINGHEQKRDENQPIEDAIFCADQAWRKIQESL